MIPILNWLWKVPVLLVLTIIAYFIAPIIACFVVYEEESAVTGFPSSMPGKPRAFLIPLFRIWQTQDAPVDEWWYGDWRLCTYTGSGMSRRWFHDLTGALTPRYY